MTRKGETVSRPIDEDELALPKSDIFTAATAFVYDVSPEFLAHHCVRSYLFARHLAYGQGLSPDVDYDDELLFLSCVLHDLGATEHGNGDQRFEVDGADAAAAFLRSHEVTESRINTVWQAIALHTSVGLAHRFGPIHAISQMGISADIIGHQRELLRTGFADTVHATWPRHNLGYALAAVIAQQVTDDPVKGPPLTFPDHVHHLHHPQSMTPTWFDLVDNAGWNDQPPVHITQRGSRA